MKSTALLSAAGATVLCTLGAEAQSGSCSNVLKPSYTAPVVGAGWTAQLIATGLSKPRGVIFDTNGNLLVVEQGKGIRRLRFSNANVSGNGTCLSISDNTSVVDNTKINHGIAFSADGKTLYASTADEVLTWSYDASSAKVSGDSRTVIRNMGGTGHTTRTLLMSAKQPGMLLVSKGSGENVDDRATDQSTGVSQIRAFDVNNVPGDAYDFASTGTRLGWGLRNSVGVAEEPTTGGIFSVENSVDQMNRNGVDVHQDNPGEELNFHGFLNGTTDNQGGNYGYPDCFALWDTNIPDAKSLVVGSQFPQQETTSLNDTTCADTRVAPRLTWQAHTAPLDMKFTPDGKEAYVTFHGSWNRDNPVGYKLSTVAFANGQPVEGRTSKQSLVDILSNADVSACPDKCFRPVGIALDTTGRVFMSSDTTGDIYVLAKADMTIGGTPSASGTLVTPSSTGNAAAAVGPRAFVGAGWGLVLTVLACFATGLGAFASRM